MIANSTRRFCCRPSSVAVVGDRYAWTAAEALEPILCHALRDEIGAHGRGATRRQILVVVLVADVIGVTFDADPQLGVLLKHRDDLVEDLRVFGEQLVGVAGEQDLHTGLEPDHVLLDLERLRLGSHDRRRLDVDFGFGGSAAGGGAAGVA